MVIDQIWSVIFLLIFLSLVTFSIFIYLFIYFLLEVTSRQLADTGRRSCFVLVFVLSFLLLNLSPLRWKPDLTIQRKSRRRRRRWGKEVGEQEGEVEEEGGCSIVAPAATAPSQYICARPQPRSCLYRDEPRSRCRCTGATGRPERGSRTGHTARDWPGRSAGADENVSTPLPVARWAQEVRVFIFYFLYI